MNRIKSVDQIDKEHRTLHVEVLQTVPISSLWVNQMASTMQHHCLLFIEDGRGRLQTMEEEVALSSHCAWLFPPGGKIQLQADDEQPLRGYSIVFDVWVIQRSVNAASASIEPALWPVSGTIEGHLVEEVRRWINESEHADSSSKEYRSFSLSVQFMALLNKFWREKEHRSHASVLREVINRTVDQMELNYSQQITREELSSLANMSPSHYSYVFKKEIGRSPMEVLAEIRIRHAKQQLLFSDRKLRDIAESVGFRNEFYFSRQFKQLVGMSPSAYAQQHYSANARVSRPFPLHLQSLGLTSDKSPVFRDTIRIVGLYVEDFLVSLGIKPVLKCVGNSFRQSYLNEYLKDVKEWSVLSFDFDAVAAAKPDLIILGQPDYGQCGRFDRFSEIAPTYSIRKGLHHWAEGMRIIGHFVNRLHQAEALIADHEREVQSAKVRLAFRERETVTLVRICNDRHIRLYGGPEGYSGVVLYQDLGFRPSETVLKTAWNRPHSYTRVEEDMLFGLNTDHLFVVVDPAGRDYWKQISGDVDWARRPFVRRGRCYEVRFDIWMTFGLIAHRLKLQDVVRCLASSKQDKANNCV